MKVTYGSLFFTLMVLFFTLGCERPEIGFLSDNIQTPESVIKPPKGIFSTAALPIIDGSTYPLKYEIVEIRDGNGEVTSELTDKHKITIWTAGYNPKTDTTMELVNKKLKQSEEPSILLNERSGQLAFTPASFFLNNNDYVLDMKVSNVKGEHIFKDFAHISFNPFVPLEFPVNSRFMVQLAKAATPNTFVNFKEQQIAPESEFSKQVLNGTHPFLKISKTSNDGAPGVKVILKIQDQNGNALAKKMNEYGFFPSGATNLSSFHDNSVETLETDEATIFNLPAPPFPQWGTYTGTSMYLMYYIIPPSAVDVDWAGLGQKQSDWGNYRGYVRFGIKINEPGTWEIVYKAQGLIRKRL
jgi:hypothetical protein